MVLIPFFSNFSRIPSYTFYLYKTMMMRNFLPLIKFQLIFFLFLFQCAFLWRMLFSTGKFSFPLSKSSFLLLRNVLLKGLLSSCYSYKHRYVLWGIVFNNTIIPPNVSYTSFLSTLFPNIHHHNILKDTFYPYV